MQLKWRFGGQLSLTNKLIGFKENKQKLRGFIVLNGCKTHELLDEVGRKVSGSSRNVLETNRKK